MTTTTLRRQLLRLAIKIHEHLAGPAKQANVPDLPHDAWEQLCLVARRLSDVRRRGWQSAVQTVALDVDYTAASLIRHVDVVRQSLSRQYMPGRVAPASEIAAELAALEAEFEQVHLDLKDRRISVVTAPITLEDVYLGPFEIALWWDRIGNATPYSVIAQDPHYAEDRSDVSHPHVHDQQLCEGEGSAAIKAALSSGRLYDFFVLVRQILETYNPDSAHVTLANWHGSGSCACCGYSLADDDGSYCERCDDHTCDDCSWGCSACGRSVCSSCSADCVACHDRFCESCLLTTDEAGRLVCQSCLEVQQKEEADEAQHQPPAEAPTIEMPGAAEAPAPEADALCLGQAAVPPRPRPHRSRRVRSQPSRRTAARRRRAAG